MTLSKARQQTTQIPMSGMPVRMAIRAPVKCCHVMPGHEVLYLGKVSGGPRHGSRGTVRQALARQAVVDMGPIGTWHIPYYFLADAEAA